MAISNTQTYNKYTLDSVTTSFDITFDCVFDDNGDATELTVWLIDSEGNRTEVTKGYASDQYTVAYKTVTYLDATSHAGETLLISRATPRTQLTDFINNGAYNLNQVEAMSDKLTRIVQEQDATIEDRIQTSESYAESAKESAEAALASEQNAKTSEDNAKESEDNAKISEDNAKESEDNAKDSAEDSEAWAVGQRNGQDVDPTDPTYHNNAQYYADLAAHLISGGVRYIGTWDTTGQTDYSSLGTPRAKGDLFYVQGTGCTIDGVEYTLGDIIIFNDDVASGVTITTSMIDKIDNTETVTPNNSVSFTKKTIPLGDNDITTTADKVIVSDASGNIGAGSVDASKIVSTDGTQTLTNKTISYADNTMPGVQPLVNYSTSEVNTGVKWIDNKDIYKQTWFVTSQDLAESTSGNRTEVYYTFPTNPYTYIDHLIKAEGSFTLLDSGTKRICGWGESAPNGSTMTDFGYSSNINISPTTSNFEVQYYKNANRTVDNIILTLFYTKTS